MGPSREPDSLSEVETAMLAFEERWWKYAGAKEAAIREQFDMSSTRYYQVLNVLIDKPAAHAASPLLVSRLRRLRDERQRQRAAARLRDQQ
jgi:Protein of unknown function (DUF3263)